MQIILLYSLIKFFNFQLLLYSKNKTIIHYIIQTINKYLIFFIPNRKYFLLFCIHKNLFYSRISKYFINIGLAMVWLKKQYGVLKFSTSLVMECMLPFPTASLCERGYLTVPFCS